MRAVAAVTPLGIVLVAAGVVGTAVFLLVQPLRQRLAPVGDLLVALRPLLIPVLVAAAAATVNFSPAVQFVAAVVLVAVVILAIVKPDLARADELKTLSKWVHLLIGVAALGIVAVIYVYLRASGFGSLLSGQSGVAGAFLIAAFIALGVAAVARLISYVTHPARWLVSVLLLLGATAGLDWVFFSRGAGGTAVTLLIAAGLVLAAVTAVAEPLWKRSAGQRAADAGRAATFAGIGLSFAILSGFLFMGATTSSLVALSHLGGESVQTRDRGDLPPKLYDKPINTLEYQHAPVLAFTEGQQWTPIPVEDYFRVDHAHIERKDGSHVPLRPDHDYSCPSIGPRKCLRVTIGCPSASEHCVQTESRHRRGNHESNGLIYARVLRRPPDQPAASDDDSVRALRAIFAPLSAKSLGRSQQRVEGVAHQTQALIQYWFFYPYDEWTSRVLGASITQRHEGDWESVSVGLGAQDRPLFVAYSAHCGGSWERWGDTVRYGTHPLVAVARGSHGNYPNAGDQRPPDFTSCTRLPRGIGTLLAFAANVRDVTADRWEWGAVEVKKVTETDWPMNFPGTWGANDVTQLRTHRDFPPSTPGGGPASPPLQALWQDPIRTIFCDRYWDGPQGCKEALRPRRGQS